MASWVWSVVQELVILQIESCSSRLSIVSVQPIQRENGYYRVYGVGFRCHFSRRLLRLVNSQSAEDYMRGTCRLDA